MARSKAQSKPRPGDVFAIPRKQGGYNFVVHLALNRFGHAFGILGGHHELPAMPDGWEFVSVARPVYTGNALVTSGRWQRVESCGDVLALFPQNPEIFHRKSDNQANPRIGFYGSGETPTGALRDLEEWESREISLDKNYRQVMLEEEFENYVQEVTNGTGTY